MSEKTPEQRAVAAETRLMVQEVAVENAYDDYWSLHRAFVRYLQTEFPAITEETATLMVADYVEAWGGAE